MVGRRSHSLAGPTLRICLIPKLSFPFHLLNGSIYRSVRFCQRRPMICTEAEEARTRSAGYLTENATLFSLTFVQARKLCKSMQICFEILPRIACGFWLTLRFRQKRRIENGGCQSWC